MKFQHFIKEWVEFWKTPVLQSEIEKNDEKLEWVCNGTVDVRGRPALREKSGGGKASVFILSKYYLYFSSFVYSGSLFFKQISYILISYLCMNCITVFVFSEALTYFTIALNMIIYLTTVWDEGVATAVKNVNYWTGTTCVMPLIAGLIADVYCGRYRMVLISSTICVLVSLRA